MNILLRLFHRVKINMMNLQFLVANRYVIYDEVKMREAGLLDEMTFEEFEEQNNEPVKVGLT